jgi:hypothetical protein
MRKVISRRSKVSGIRVIKCLNGFSKGSKGVFKQQHCEWAKCTVGTNGTAVRGVGPGLNCKRGEYVRDVNR